MWMGGMDFLALDYFVLRVQSDLWEDF